MQPQQSSRIDLAELKAQMVRKIGVEKCKMYFCYLTRFLSHKLTKSELDRICYRILGKENLPMHNQLILSMLKNACHAKTPPLIREPGLAKSAIQTVKSTPGGEDGLEQVPSIVPNQNPNMSIWSNGVLPISPRKTRSGIRDRKHKDRPSPLGPNGKVDCLSHQPLATEDSTRMDNMENGDLVPCDYLRPLRHLQAVAEQPEIQREGSDFQLTQKPRIPSIDQLEVEDEEKLEQALLLNHSRRPLLAPLGISLGRVGGFHKGALGSGDADSVSYSDYGGLSDSGTLRQRMEQIACGQGLGGVSMECANMMNNVLDVYLKKLIKSCVDLVGARSEQEPMKHPVHKQQKHSKNINGVWPANHLQMHSSTSMPLMVMQDQKPQTSISLLDFKTAMELSPRQLGEDWPLLLEKISMHSLDE